MLGFFSKVMPPLLNALKSVSLSLPNYVFYNLCQAFYKNDRPEPEGALIQRGFVIEARSR